MALLLHRAASPSIDCVEIRVRGRVQGVGFRPTVWRIARELGLTGEVLNDSEGVLIRAAGLPRKIADLSRRIARAPPPLARIDAIEVRPYFGSLPSSFVIADSVESDSSTQICPDAALCEACAEDVFNATSRRFMYPFATCTHCGPRLTIVTGIPYDRARTTMSPFDLCEACAAEYQSPADRRFRAEATACPVCGPTARLVSLKTREAVGDPSTADAVDAAARLIQEGEIVAIKGLGGYQIACDAMSAKAVAALRARKKRDAKPFALMARDLEVVRRFCSMHPAEERALTSPEGPIVLLSADGPETLPREIAPGLVTLGFMLPTTPLHALLLRGMNGPVVMTSGNHSDEPQAIEDADARERLGSIATHALIHDRPIANRVDDSVVRRSAGKIRILRRARGYAPSAIRLPQGFEDAPEILAFGGELKSTFCIVKHGEAVLSQHQGDLEDARTFNDYKKNMVLFEALFDSRPRLLAADRHPEYLSTKLASEQAREQGLPLIEVQHHHAHIAACLAENGRPLDTPPVLGIALDGLGFGDDGEIWGGEFLHVDYRGYRRVGTFKPIAMLGGAQAARQPWRNLYAHLMSAIGWDALALDFAGLDLITYLEAKPRTLLDAMLASGTNAPKATSCGRLFDAVAAAIDLCREVQAYEGEAAARLEAAVDPGVLRDETEALAYPFKISTAEQNDFPHVDPTDAWRSILNDLVAKAPSGTIAARFHKGLAQALVAMALSVREQSDRRFDTVALSGGCFQNRVLLEETMRGLQAHAFEVLTHCRVPANDGGIALGQAAIAAARFASERRHSMSPP